MTFVKITTTRIPRTVDINGAEQAVVLDIYQYEAQSVFNDYSDTADFLTPRGNELKSFALFTR